MKSTLERMWKQSPPLMVCTGIMVLLLVGCTIGIFVDPRTVTGAPVWLKPAKFALSTATFTASFAWLFQYLPSRQRLTRFAGWTLTAVLAIEIVLIDLQAARGVPSHFNQATTFDRAVFGVMGVAIAVLWVTSAVITWALFREKFADRAWGWALRLGMLIYLLGASTGGMMVSPSHDQIKAIGAREKVDMIGSHTVGAPDGGEGIPGVGWSAHHGDIRIAHFFGMHAMQIVPLFAWMIGRARRGTGLVIVTAASYFALTAILTWQALRGQSIIEPDAKTLAAFAAWALATATATLVFGRKESYESRAAVLTV